MYSDYKSLTEMEAEISDCVTIDDAMERIGDILFDISVRVASYEKANGGASEGQIIIMGNEPITQEKDMISQLIMG